MPNGFHQYLVVDIVEAAFDVTFEHPIISSNSIPVFVDGQDAFQRASLWSESIGVWQEVCFINWFEKHLQRHLYGAVFDCWNAYWALFSAGLWNILPQDRGGSVSLSQLFLQFIEKLGSHVWVT
jgi:hypothetical protein